MTEDALLRELPQHPLVQLVTPVERHLPVRDAVLSQSSRDSRDYLGCDELVRPAVHEGEASGLQATHDCPEREVQIGRKFAAPEREAIDLGLPQPRPAT